MTKKPEEFYDQLQNVIDQTPKKDILVVKRLECKSGQVACGNWLGKHRHRKKNKPWVTAEILDLCDKGEN